MNADQLSEELTRSFISEVDSRTLRANISRRDAARVYRELANELLDRAAGLDEEAEADGE